MNRLTIVLLAAPSIALADLPPDIEDRVAERPALSEVAAPCLMEKADRRYVVTWEIRNTVTGERRNIGSQELRLRC